MNKRIVAAQIGMPPAVGSVPVLNCFTEDGTCIQYQLNTIKAAEVLQDVCGVSVEG